jgi:2-dehydropantoate 2-reductase
MEGIMKVAIAGAGAVGCHYGSLLQQTGCDVVFLARGPHLQAMQTTGLKHTSLDWQRELSVRADDDPSVVADAHAVLITCKTTGLDEMCRQLVNNLPANALLVTLQNGVQAPDMVAKYFPDHSIVAGSAFIGARIEAPGHVVHSAAGHIRLGLWQNNNDPDIESTLESLLSYFQQAGVDARRVVDAKQLLWNKMLWNCGFNAITALTCRYARDIANEEATAELALAAMQEAVLLADAMGVSLPEHAAEKQLAISKKLGLVKTSMWQDIEQARPTEIDAMNGYISATADELGHKAPANRMLATLIRALDHCR